MVLRLGCVLCLASVISSNQLVVWCHNTKSLSLCVKQLLSESEESRALFSGSQTFYRRSSKLMCACGGKLASLYLCPCTNIQLSY